LGRKHNIFCFQCQETAKNTSCTVRGVCGKPEESANLQDLLIFVLKGISVYGEKLKELGESDRTNDDFIAQGLFATITNTNCLVPLKKNNTYLDRLFTTGVVGYEGAVHIADRPAGGTKNFSALIEKAKTCPPLPGFLSPNVAKVLVEKFDIKPICTVGEDISAMMSGN